MDGSLRERADYGKSNKRASVLLLSPDGAEQVVLVSEQRRDCPHPDRCLSGPRENRLPQRLER